MKKLEENYDEKGNASHYNSERVNAIHIFEQTYGTLAVMHFCEINALKYRLRIGKKKSQSLEQEVLKAEWYERAAKYFFNKIESGLYETGVDGEFMQLPETHGLPWESEKKS